MIDLTLLDKTKTNAIVIRHAERDKTKNRQTEGTLNEQGKKNALLLGEKLHGFKNYAFFSSPVSRCCQTIEYMQMGIFHDKKREKNIVSTLLGKPGVFIIDSVNNIFKTISSIQVVEMLIDNKKLEGIRSISDGTKLLIDFVKGQMDDQEIVTLLVFVTHEPIIALVCFYLTGEIFNEKHIPDFLDGFIIKKGEKDFEVIRKSDIFEIRSF